MPKIGKSGHALKAELPSTLQRSARLAQDTFAKAFDSAAEEYGDGQRAARTAYAALKHTHEKVGDHWEPKEKPGPSDARAAGGRGSPGATAGGINANATKAHLYEVASTLDISGRSKMTKDELVTAIGKANDRKTRRARQG